MSDLPFVPYEGNEPYIFVSYAHKNKDKVYPIIKRLHEMGYRLWYDEGIQPGKEWGDEVQRHLENAAMMLLFLSPVAVERKNVRSEIQFAWSKNIPILGVDLVKTEELKYGLGLWLQLAQRVLYYNYKKNETAFYEKLQKGLSKETWESAAKSSLPIVARVSPETDFDWEFEGDTAVVKKYKGEDKDVAIPNTFQGKKVVEIRFQAFESNMKIENVVIPEGVMKIGSGAFRTCSNLRKVALPQSIVEIGVMAFNLSTRLNHVVLPKNIERIDEYTFYGCYSLTNITIPKSVSFIGKKAFGDEDSLMYFPNLNLTFHCPCGSFAEKYANEHNFKVQYTD